MDKNNSHWVSVAISDGMFSTEYAVSLKLADGNAVSFFADKKLVRAENNGKGSLEVMLINTDAVHKKQLVLLPTETFETASRWAEIRAE